MQFIFDRDDVNAKTLARMLSFSDAPDAIMWYIDHPDHPGHNHGFYPYSPEYKEAVRESDGYVGEVLAAIAARPTFAEEDWLVIVTADHGGWGHDHGQSSTQCYTIPLIIAGRHVAQARIPGVPHNYDAAPTALAHFGIDVSKIDFDGKVRGGEVAQEPVPRPIEDGRAVYLPFTAGSMDNKGSADVVAEIIGAAAPVADGVVRFYQGRRDGNLHCVADDLSDIALKTGKPFFLGQDGTGKYRHPFVGDIDEFSLWTRTLSHEEVRRLFEAGRKEGK